MDRRICSAITSFVCHLNPIYVVFSCLSLLCNLVTAARQSENIEVWTWKPFQENNLLLWLKSLISLAIPDYYLSPWEIHSSLLTLIYLSSSSSSSSYSAAFIFTQKVLLPATQIIFDFSPPPAHLFLEDQVVSDEEQGGVILSSLGAGTTAPSSKSSSVQRIANPNRQVAPPSGSDVAKFARTTISDLSALCKCQQSCLSKILSVKGRECCSVHLLVRQSMS